MKNFTALMQKGDLRPKERMLLWVHNAVAKEKTGKEILTEAEKYSLIEGWTPGNNEEAREYNRYNKGWVLEGSMRIDAQTAYLNAIITLFQARRMVDYALWTGRKNERKNKEGGYVEYCKKSNLGLNKDDVLNLVLENTGLAFDQVVHACAFQGLGDEIKQDMLALDPGAETSSQYFDQEETLASLFNGKEYLTAEDKEKVADLILAILRNPFTGVLRKFNKEESEIDEWWFCGYFAELPSIAIAKKWADNTGVSYDPADENLESALSEKIQNYAKEHSADARTLLKETILRWLDNGLFVSEYTPLWNSGRKNTCNGTDTKLPHKEVLKQWLQAKSEAKIAAQKLIDAGQLKVEVREKDFWGVRETMKIITGESLYAFEGDLAFVGDFKRQAEDLMPLGCLILFLQERDLLSEYASLLAFAEIFKKLSAVYEIDLGYKITEFIRAFGENVELLNKMLRFIFQNREEAAHAGQHIKFPIEIFIDNSLIRLEKVQPMTEGAAAHYAEEFKKLLGNEF